jgi:hypothetical protein
MHRRYNRWHARFDQPDPYDGSYNLTNPQSFNRYSYVQNDPVNFVDPLGLDGFNDLAPPPPTYVPPLPTGPLDVITTNTSDRRPGGGVGSIFGGNDMFVPVEEPEGNPGGDVGGAEPQDPLPRPVPVPVPTPAPHVKPCDRNGVKYNQEELDDLAGNLGGKITYTKPGKPDSEALITNLYNSPTFSQFEQRLRENDWSPIWFNMSKEHWGGEDWKRKGKYGNWYHITVYPVDYRRFPRNQEADAKNLSPPKKITIHCDNGNPQDPLHER